MFNFVSAVVRQYTINQNCVRVAVIRYSDRADATIHLHWYSDINSLTQAIGQMKLLGGSASNLNIALDLLRTQVFASNIVRDNAVRIAIIVSDNLQQNDLITTAANNAKSQGITLVGVAITGPQRVNVNYFYTSVVSNRWLVQVGDYSQLVSGARDTIVRQYGCFPYTTTPAPIPSKSSYTLATKSTVRFTLSRIRSTLSTQLATKSKAILPPLESVKSTVSATHHNSSHVSENKRENCQRRKQEVTILICLKINFWLQCIAAAVRKRRRKRLYGRFCRHCVRCLRFL